MINATWNLDWVQTATVVQSSNQVAGYPATNVRDASHPDMPWKTTSANVVHFVDLDLGATPRPVEIMAALYTNYDVCYFVADNAPTFNSGTGGAPQYDSGAINTRTNPGNGRRCGWKKPTTPVTRRYWRFAIVAATPLTGIPNQEDYAAGYRTGAVILAPLTANLRNFRWEYDPTPAQEIATVRVVSGSAQTLVLGPERMQISGTLNALTGYPVALLDDGVAAWLDFERLWKVSGRAFIAPNPSHPYWCGVMRQANSPSRSVALPADEVRFEWEEVN